MVRQRRARSPEWLAVDRDALRDLGPIKAMVRAAIQYMCKNEKPITGVEIAAWLDRDPSNISHARDGLQYPLPPYPPDDRRRRSWLKVDLRVWREKGAWAAIVLAQLQTWPKQRFWGQRWLIAAHELVQLLGCCEKTARKALRALTGAFLDVVWRTGLPAAVRLLGGREKPLADPPPLPPKPTEPEPPTSRAQQRAPSSGVLDPRLHALLENLPLK